MLKIPDLRAHLVAAVPELARDPELSELPVRQ